MKQEKKKINKNDLESFLVGVRIILGGSSWKSTVGSVQHIFFFFFFLVEKNLPKMLRTVGPLSVR